MPSVLDLAARLSDALKDTEFHRHPSRLAMQNNVKELLRVRWSLQCSPLLRDKMFNNDALRDDTVRAFDAATALCRKLRLFPRKTIVSPSAAAIAGTGALHARLLEYEYPPMGISAISILIR